MDLVDEMIELTEGQLSPDIFRKWAAIGLVSIALSRDKFSQLLPEPTYPNLFVLLVGPPGCGKTVALNAVERWADRTDTIKKLVLPNSCTMRAMTGLLGIEHDKDEKFAGSNKNLNVICKGVGFFSEFNNFLGPLDRDMFSALAELWDCKEKYWHKTQHSGEDHIRNVYLAFVAGVQPSYFADIPATVYQRGLPSRLIMIHSDEVIDPVYGDYTQSEENRIRNKQLISALAGLDSKPGKYLWTREAIARLNKWIKEERDITGPVAAGLEDYRARRAHHLIKLAMIAGASQHQDIRVEVGDFERAIEWLTEAEEFMPKAVEHVGTSASYQVEVAAMAWLQKEYDRRGLVGEPALRRVLTRSMPAYQVDGVIDGLIKQNKIEARKFDKQKVANKAPNRNFAPLK